MNVWLVRHGATDWSDAGRLTGRTDVELNEAGRRQALALGDRLSDLRVDGVWTSPAQRAVETARLALREPSIDDRLAELDFGELEGLTWEECTPAVQASLLEFDDFVAPGGESVAALRLRVHAFLDELPDGAHVVFTHGGVIRLLLRERGLDRRVAPGEVVTLPLASEGTPGDNR